MADIVPVVISWHVDCGAGLGDRAYLRRVRARRIREGDPLGRIFAKFDEGWLVFLYQDVTSDGQPSRFCKFIGWETAEEASSSG